MKDTITAKDIEDTVNRLKAMDWKPPTEADIARYIKQRRETDRIIETGAYCVVDDSLPQYDGVTGRMEEL